jgi:hypothetical protein
VKNAHCTLFHQVHEAQPSVAAHCEQQPLGVLMFLPSGYSRPAALW